MEAPQWSKDEKVSLPAWQGFTLSLHTSHTLDFTQFLQLETWPARTCLSAPSTARGVSPCKSRPRFGLCESVDVARTGNHITTNGILVGGPQKTNLPQLFFALVDLKDFEDLPDIFVVPSRIIFGYFEGGDPKTWPRARYHPEINEIEKYKNNWKLLETELEMKS